MALENQDETIHQGQDATLTYAITEGGSPKDLAGATITWKLFDDPSDDDGDALISKTASIVNVNATGDGARVALEPADTQGFSSGLYWSELWAIDGASNEVPLATGWITIKLSPQGRS
jgi:hypothetical protein